MAIPTRTVAPAAVLAALFIACAPESAAPTPDAGASRLYWALTLDRRAVTLSSASPYDTLRVTATPRTATGEPLSELGTPTYVSSDVEKVQVDADGLLRAIDVTTGVRVVATLTLDDITHTDTVFVNVTADAPPPILAALSIDPIPPDSAKTAVGSRKLLAARATDPNGSSIAGVAVYYESSDPAIATVDARTGLVRGVRMGEVTFYATATAYGITRADTLPFTIGLPIALAVDVIKQPRLSGDPVVVFNATTAVIGVGAAVTWFNRIGELVDVTFEDPTNVIQNDTDCAFYSGIGLPEVGCGSGDIPAWVNTTSSPFLQRTRRFAAPGTYRYRSELHGSTGTIIVQ